MTTVTGFTINRMSIQLLVNDLERSVAFYTNMLGFDVEFRYEAFYAGLIKDGCSLHLKSGIPSGTKRTQKENEDTDVLFSVSDIEKICKELQDKQVLFIQPLRQMPYGKEFYIGDPDGHVLAFIQEG